MVADINITSVRQFTTNCSIGISSSVLYIQRIKICFGILKRAFFIILRCSARGFLTRSCSIDNAVKSSFGCLNRRSSFGDFTRTIRVAIERRLTTAGFLSAHRWRNWLMRLISPCYFSINRRHLPCGRLLFKFRRSRLCKIIMPSPAFKRTPGNIVQ